MKYTWMAATLLLSSVAHAEIINTPTQNQLFFGTAGNKSTEPGVDPFSFSKFDTSLGSLNDVFVRYSMTIDNGLLGADNLTNDAVVGTGTLGGSVLLKPEFGFLKDDFSPIFEKISLSQTETLNLAADPTMSLGGSGPDVDSFNGGFLEKNVGWLTVNKVLLSNFLASPTNDSFTIDIDTSSVVKVDAGGSQGFFQAVDVGVNMDLYYSYDKAPEADVSDVTSPGVLAAAGLVILIVSGGLRRKI